MVKDVEIPLTWNQVKHGIGLTVNWLLEGFFLVMIFGALFSGNWDYAIIVIMFTVLSVFTSGWSGFWEIG